MVFEKYPYSSFGDLNLDWILEKVREAVETATNTKADQVALRNFVETYFANLDVQEEINTKLAAMGEDGSLGEIVDPYVVSATAEWLAEHITPTSPAVDSSLSVAGAAADAAVVGTQIGNLKSAITPYHDLFTVPVTFADLNKTSMWTVGQAIQAETGYTDTGKSAYIRTAWIPFDAPTLIWIDSQTYKFIVWGYSAISSTAGTYSPQKVYAQNPVVIAPIPGTVSLRLGVTRVDGATMTNTDVTNVISALRTYQLPGIRSGMKIACFGDSIMWGRDGNGSASTQVSETIPKHLSKALGCQCDNYGLGNQAYLPHSGVVSAYDTIASVDLTKYDAMIMCFGVNDGFNDLGEWDSTDEGTIMGQFNKIVNYVFAQNPKIRLIVIAPWNGSNVGTAPDYWYGQRTNLLGYVSRRILSDTLKTACDHYWIPYIEQYDSPINPLNITTALPDGVHPSADFYKLLGEWLAAKITTII